MRGCVQANKQSNMKERRIISRSMTSDKLFTSLTIPAKLTTNKQFAQTRLETLSAKNIFHLTLKMNQFRSSCRNVSHQQQFVSELPSPKRK